MACIWLLSIKEIAAIGKAFSSIPDGQFPAATVDRLFLNWALLDSVPHVLHPLTKQMFLL